MWNSTFGRISSSSVHCAARSILLAFGCVATAYVSIPDYGWNYSLFTNLAYDPTGWLHEVFYIWVFVAAMVFGSIMWQLLQTMRNVGILLGACLKRITKEL